MGTCTATSVQTCLKDCTNLHYQSQYNYMKIDGLSGQLKSFSPQLNISSHILSRAVAKINNKNPLPQHSKIYKAKNFFFLVVWCNLRVVFAPPTQGTNSKTFLTIFTSVWAARLLQKSLDGLLWVFTQGEISPYHSTLRGRVIKLDRPLQSKWGRFVGVDQI